MSRAPGTTPYLLPTPAGAFAAAAEPDDNPIRAFMIALLAHEATPSLAAPEFLVWSGLGSLDDAYDWIGRLQALGWLQGLAEPRRAPAGPLETILGNLLPSFGREGRVLLADSHGFQIGSHGFTHEVAEELSALSADIAALHQRRHVSLNRNLGLPGSAWGLVDAAGQSQLGFWPLHAGNERFVLVVAGMPTFNRPQLVDLVWTLLRRYAAAAQP